MRTEQKQTRVCRVNHVKLFGAGTKLTKDVAKVKKTNTLADSDFKSPLSPTEFCFSSTLPNSQVSSIHQKKKKKKISPTSSILPPSQTLSALKIIPVFLASSSNHNLFQGCSWSSSAGPSGTGLTGRRGRGMYHCQAKCGISIFGVCQTPPPARPNPYLASPEEAPLAPEGSRSAPVLISFFYGRNKETFSVTWYIIITSFVTLSPQMYRKQASVSETQTERARARKRGLSCLSVKSWWSGYLFCFPLFSLLV